MTQEKKMSQLLVKLSEDDRLYLDFVAEKTGLTNSDVVRKLLRLAADHVSAQLMVSTAIPGVGKEVTLDIAPRDDFDKIGRILNHIGAILMTRKRPDLYAEVLATISGQDFDRDEFNQMLAEIEKKFQAQEDEEEIAERVPA